MYLIVNAAFLYLSSKFPFLLCVSLSVALLASAVSLFCLFTRSLISRMGILEMAVRSMAEAADLMLVSYCLFLLSVSIFRLSKEKIEKLKLQAESFCQRLGNTGCPLLGLP